MNAILMYGFKVDAHGNAVEGIEETPCYRFFAPRAVAAEEPEMWAQYVPRSHTVASFSYRIDDATNHMQMVEFEVVSPM